MSFRSFCYSIAVINAENAAHRSEKFATMATRTRQEYLKDLASNYTTATVVDPGQKFCKASCNALVFMLRLCVVSCVACRYKWLPLTAVSVHDVKVKGSSLQAHEIYFSFSHISQFLNPLSDFH